MANNNLNGIFSTKTKAKGGLPFAFVIKAKLHKNIKFLKLRYLVATKIDNFSADTLYNAMMQALGKLTPKSITFDNSSEFARFRDMARGLNTTVYFADPNAPWQRGSNENTNGVLRFFFPKGTNFHTVRACSH